MFDKGEKLTVKYVVNKPIKSYIYIGKTEEEIALETVGKFAELVTLLTVVIKNLAKKLVNMGVPKENVIATLLNATSIAVTHAIQEAHDDEQK